MVVEQPYEKKLGDSPANFLINRGVMATLQERRLGYHSRAGLEPGTSRFSTLRINHYAAWGMTQTAFATVTHSEGPGTRTEAARLGAGRSDPCSPIFTLI